jgi:predicted anti-sigma-YlaC factor YlaD
MNCREAQRHLFAEGEGALESSQRVTLEEHVGHCPDCRRMRDDLTAALSAWRSENARTPVPDADREWHAVRRRIRGGVEPGAEHTVRPRRNLFAWAAVPIGVAAAAAVALMVSKPEPAGTSLPLVAYAATAESIDVPGGDAATMVFVDEKSGWLMVMASDAPKRG